MDVICGLKGCGFSGFCDAWWNSNAMENEREIVVWREHHYKERYPISRGPLKNRPFSGIRPCRRWLTRCSTWRLLLLSRRRITLWTGVRAPTNAFFITSHRLIFLQIWALRSASDVIAQVPVTWAQVSKWKWKLKRSRFGWSIVGFDCTNCFSTRLSYPQNHLQRR